MSLLIFDNMKSVLCYVINSLTWICRLWLILMLNSINYSVLPYCGQNLAPNWTWAKEICQHVQQAESVSEPYLSFTHEWLSALWAEEVVRITSPGVISCLCAHMQWHGAFEPSSWLIHFILLMPIDWWYGSITSSWRAHHFLRHFICLLIQKRWACLYL